MKVKKEDFGNLVNSVKSVLTPIHKDGFIVIIVAFVVALFFLMFSETLGSIFIVVALFCLYFFRDPNRVIPKEKGLVVSPADGKIANIVHDCKVPSNLMLNTKKKWTRVSIFLGIFDVHVNRVPISGKIVKMHYNQGLFLNASLDKASESNERQSCVVETKEGQQVGFVQIAGLIARRIVCDLHEGQIVETGEKYGIIKFGSRVDVYLPEGVKPRVAIGQTAVGGETVIASLKEVRRPEMKRVAKTVGKRRVATKKKSVEKKPAKRVVKMEKK